jgi:uncharacterized membrane protein (DUF2068 family)
MFADDDRTEIFNRSHLDFDLGPARAPVAHERAAHVIVLYKLARSGVSLLLALGLTVILVLGRTESFVQAAVLLRQHFTSSFASSVVDQLLRNVVPIRLWLVVAALACDGALSAVEGFALRTGKTWGVWLVLIATTALVPAEIWGLLRAPHVGRAILLLVNVVAAIYLLRRAMRDDG